MRKILVTGFEPFAGRAENASWEVVRRLPPAIGDLQIHTLQVPVVFDLAAETVAGEASRLCPDMILCLGLASGRSSITPEYVAINLRNASIPDNKGSQPCDAPVADKGPAAYFTTLPVRKMAKAMSETGIPAEVSYSAGTFVCNDLMYSLLHKYKDTNVGVGFIHVPELAGPDGGETDAGRVPTGLSLQEAVTAVIEAIRVLI